MTAGTTIAPRHRPRTRALTRGGQRRRPDARIEHNESASRDLEALRRNLAARLPALGGVRSTGDGLESRCRLYLERVRWPGGVRCPRCDEEERLLWLDSRAKWHCYSCRYQFSVTAGTLFHGSHLPLWKWLIAVHLMAESPEGISANELMHVFGGSYKTFWFTTHRIRVAMRAVARGQSHPDRAPWQLLGKYAAAYADERRWRAANARNPHAFRDTVAALVHGGRTSYRELVAG